MLSAARTVCDLVRDYTLARYLSDRRTQLAVERAIEIIGEAARRVSEAIKAQHPEIPWQGIVAQRHVLAHDYGEIIQERIWLLATGRIPELINQLEPLLPPLPR
jgi:uncharacterized protein with HEPN domain